MTNVCPVLHESNKENLKLINLWNMHVSLLWLQYFRRISSVQFWMISFYNKYKNAFIKKNDHVYILQI